MLEDVAYISLRVKVVVTQSVQGTTQVASFLKHSKRFYFHCNAKFLVPGNQLVPRRKSGNRTNGLSVAVSSGYPNPTRYPVFHLQQWHLGPMSNSAPRSYAKT